MHSGNIKQKTRLTIKKAFANQDIWIEFTDEPSRATYRYPHDGLLREFKKHAPGIFDGKSWKQYKNHNWGQIPIENGKYPFVRPFLSKYRITK